MATEDTLLPESAAPCGRLWREVSARGVPALAAGTIEAMRSRRHTIAAAVAALALLAVLLAPSGAVALERTIAVKGAATRDVANDTASLTFSVSKERKTRGAALRAVSTRLRAVIAAVQTVPGVGPGDISTGRISVREIRRDEQSLFRASEGIVVILHQPENAGDMVSTAIAAGATGTGGPNFFPANPDQAYQEALVAAFDQAKARAAVLAARAGAILGPVVAIEEGGEVIPASPQATSVRGSDKATPPVKPGTSTVTASVRVVFALQ